MADLTDRVTEVISDPGAVIARNGNESTSRWAARAVLTLLVRGRLIGDPEPGDVNPLALAALWLLALAIGLVLGAVFL